MKVTSEQAEYLLSLPKKIIQDNIILDKIVIEQKYPVRIRFELLSEQDGEFSFLWEIKQSGKNRIAISFHYQEDIGKTGLLRIDYNRGHKNPQTINDNVPEKFKPYVGAEFFENHIHYHVQGYKSLAWAIPLIDDDFAIKEIDDNSDYNTTFANVIKHFADVINLKTEITIHLLLL